jgi:hypothetical protein
MAAAAPPDVTGVLRASSAGDDSAVQTAVLVHEADLRAGSARQAFLQNPSHLYARSGQHSLSAHSASAGASVHRNSWDKGGDMATDRPRRIEPPVPHALAAGTRLGPYEGEIRRGLVRLHRGAALARPRRSSAGHAAERRRAEAQRGRTR